MDEKRHAELVRYANRLEQRVANLERTLKRLEEENRTLKAIKVPAERREVAFRWVLGVVGFPVEVSSQFIESWEVYTNKERSWVGMVPREASAETKRFSRAFNAARRAKGFDGGFWRSGVQLEIPRKREKP